MKNKNDISQELLEATERYVSGTMEAKEFTDFNNKLKTDPEFKAEFEDIKTLLFGIETQSFKEQLNDFHNAIPETKKGNTSSTKIRYLNFSKIAVAAIILIAAGSLWFFSASPNEKIYAKHFKPDPGLPTTMSSTTNFDFYDAMVNYKHEDYNVAIKKWRILSKSQPENDTLNYFIGAAYLANKNEAEAIPFLERAVKSKDNFTFKKEANYYLGLAYLKNENIEMAKKHLKLSNSDSAKEILLELEN